MLAPLHPDAPTALLLLPDECSPLCVMVLLLLLLLLRLPLCVMVLLLLVLQLPDECLPLCVLILALSACSSRREARGQEVSAADVAHLDQAITAGSRGRCGHGW